MRPHFRSTSSQIRKNMSTKVFLPMDGESLSQISSQIDGEVTGCENSGDPTIAIAGINGVSVEKKYSHYQSTHVTTQPNQIDREINNNNITSSQTDHKFDEQQENHESAGEHSRCIRKDTRNVTANATSLMEAKARINENNRGRSWLISRAISWKT